jgi:type III secretory pathway lipoprotein EscJ
VRESLDSFLLYLFFYVLILYLLTRNALIYVHLNSIGANQLLAVQRCASWSLEPVGTVG